jgi:hypothetical protein
MTKQDSQQIIEDQRQDWNRVAGAWEKWDRLFEEQAGYLNHRLKPFTPNTRQTLKNYYEVPVDIVESADTLVEWARAAANR